VEKNCKHTVLSKGTGTETPENKRLKKPYRRNLEKGANKTQTVSSQGGEPYSRIERGKTDNIGLLRKQAHL